MTVEPITKPRKPSNDSTPRIYTAIAAVMSEVGKEGISKDRRNEQQGYKFRGIDDVYNALAPILAKHDLIVIPKCLSRELVERKNAKGNPLFYVTCQVEFTLICSLDGSSVQCVTYGEAMDSADKATNKAMSAAYKYMAMQTFCIPTEGDNDADATTHDVAPTAGGERPPAQTPPRQQTTSIRQGARPFIEKASAELQAAAGDFDAVTIAFDAIKARPGWQQLNDAERAAVNAEKAKALPDVP